MELYIFKKYLPEGQNSIKYKAVVSKGINKHTDK